jgi:Na+-transporting methylmalonyl-CoA/oxaloacetate decarboxylase gamma subunit
MGQEIVHCSVCGVRLRSHDFEKGDAIRVEHTAYCKKCSPHPIPTPAHAPSSSTTTRRKQSSTGQIPVVTPRRPMEAVPDQATSPLLLWGGAGVVVAVLILIAFMVTGRSRPAPVTVTPPPPAPETAERKEPAPAPLVEKTKSVKDAAPTLPPGTEAAELTVIDRKLADLSAQERFGEAMDVLKRASGRYDTLEWTSGIQRRTREIESTVKALYIDLQEKAAKARQRGAEAEARTLLDRIARWDMPGYSTEAPRADKSGAPPPPAPTPVPPPAPPPVVNAKPPAIPFVPGAQKWTLLTPVKMSAGPGETLTLLEDGSVLAGGELPQFDRYVVAVQTDVKGITGFRLEVLPDPSLPASGPGRSPNGNFVLSEFKVHAASDPQAVAGTPLAIEHAAASFNQEVWGIYNAIDGKNELGWAILPQIGKANEAVFELKAPLAAASALIFHLENQSLCGHHSIGRFRLSATTAKNPALELAARLTVDPSRVEKAIQKGVAWLRNPGYPADYAWSPNELILWTFIHAGVPESDPEFQRRLKQMLDGPLDKTYRVALQAMILEELDRVAYQHRIWQCAQFLVDNQCLNGQWHYGTPTEIPKGVPTPAKPPVATVAKLDGEGRRVKPKVARKMAARKTRDGPAEGDNSNSQYAALGLRACFDAGVLPPEDTVLKAVKWWRESQYFDEGRDGEYASKGWSYTSPAKDAKPYHAMTAGGISSLVIYDYILGRDWKKTGAIKSGVNWITQNWTVNNNFYYLYGLERAAVLHGGLDKFGRHSWYPLGAQWILDHQDETSGCWITHPWDKGNDELVWNTFDTCFAILFLKRATRPLVSSEDRR